MEIHEIVITVVCLIVFWLLLFCSYTQIRSRDSIFDMWNKCPWVSTNERHKYPLWLILIALAVSFIPIINVITIAATLATYFIQMKGKLGSESSDLEDERIVVRVRWLNWLGKLLSVRV